MSVKVQRRFFSTFPASMETSAPPHGVPRGAINRMISLGLPPWAAWCRKLDNFAIYRMSAVKPRQLRPKMDAKTDEIWDEARVRERIQTSPSYVWMYQKLVYPWMNTGIWHSDALDHWVQVPQSKQATVQMEREGGIDNYILSRTGSQLASQYGERLRRHILVRQKEIQKNFILEKQAGHLSRAIVEELKEAKSKKQVSEIMEKYSLSSKFVERVEAKLREAEEDHELVEVEST